MKTKIEKKNELRLGSSISNYASGFLNFLRITAFTILVKFKNFVIRL